MLQQLHHLHGIGATHNRPERHREAPRVVMIIVEEDELEAQGNESSRDQQGWHGEHNDLQQLRLEDVDVGGECLCGYIP